MKRRYATMGILILGLALTAMFGPLAVQAVNPIGPAGFNGDGYADLAVGAHHEAIGTTTDAGAVNVLYGASTAGLGAAGAELWYQGNSGLVDTAEQDDEFGRALAVGDFDGDGYMDLAVGVHGENDNAGAVHILYGYNSATGLAATGNELLSQNSPGIVDEEGAGEYFGEALAAGDFNGDGYADLAVGVYGQSVDTHSFAGAVHILYGSAAGLGGSNELWHQNSSGILDAAEAFDIFGKALAAGDFNGDGRDDLAVGVPQEDTGASEISGAGVVQVLYGSAAGLTATGNQEWYQDSSGIADEAEAGDGFGAALAAGDFNGDGRDDLAVGVSFEDTGFPEVSDAGAVQVLYGSAAGLTATGSQEWWQGSPGIADEAEADDRFGSDLAAGDFNGDGRDDLAVGVSAEDTGASEISDAGVVQVLYGSAAGLTVTGNQEWYQDSSGIADYAEAGDGFGVALAAGDFNGDDRDDLAVGVPFEDTGSPEVSDAGAVQVLYGSAAGLTATGNQEWYQDSPGIGGAAEASDCFGFALATISRPTQRVYLPLVLKN